tara:strand:+ start:112 stop:741 length:630 start_codon:yes stop_codon:yes gene_type:complete
MDNNEGPAQIDNKADRHAEKMAKKKAARNKIMATKTKTGGLTIVHTGKGKGKSTAAFGMVCRALGHGMRVGVIQFVKGKWETGEKKILEAFSHQVAVHTMGEGFTWDTQDLNRDIAAADAAWNQAKVMMQDPSYSMILLDELNIVLRYDYLSIDDVVKTIKNKREDLHIIITGRNAKEELIEISDLVTEMTMIKHPFRSGFKAQAGIEF